jgi:hypothetical protein
MADEAEITAARAAADAVLERARTDEAFSAQLRADPVGVLTAAGIDPDAAEHFAGELLPADAPDVSGFARCTWGTCWVSVCNAWPGTGFDRTSIELECGRMVGGVRG